jgi:peptide-methionine (S)-S-oxide reductase
MSGQRMRSGLRRGLATLLLGLAALVGALAQRPATPPPTSAAAPSVPTAKATFAGGCFWCVESDFDKVDGVLSTTSGYTGGTTVNPSYEQVSSKTTGHAESVEVVYDPKKVSYEQLLTHFWHSIDPTTKDRQFCDVGSPYRTVIFVHGAAQRQAAEASRTELEKTKPFAAPIVTEIVDAGPFYPAEDYHQDYYLKNPIRYHYYRSACGRDARLEQLWGPLAGK